MLNAPGTNPRVDGFEKVRNFGSRKFNILRLEDLRKDKSRLGAIFGTGQLVGRTSNAMFWSY